MIRKERSIKKQKNNEAQGQIKEAKSNPNTTQELLDHLDHQKLSIETHTIKKGHPKIQEDKPEKEQK